MSTQPVDYAALAEQARQQAAPKVDYAALAEQARQGGSTPEQPVPILAGYQRAGRILKEGGKDLLSAVGSMADAVASGPLQGALKIGQGMVGGHVQAYQDAKDAAEQGNTAKSMFKSVAAGVPVVGPMASDIYDDAEAGNNDRAVGKGLSRILQVAAPEIAPHVLPAAGKVASGAVDTLNSARGALAEKAVAPLVRKPLGATLEDAKFGRDPVKAITDEGLAGTKEQVLEQAKSRVGQISDAVDQTLKNHPNSGAQIDAAPIIDSAIDNAVSSAKKTGNKAVVTRLENLREALKTEYGPTKGTPYEINQLKREVGQIGSDLGAFKSTDPLEASAAGAMADVYSGLKKAVNQQVPEIAPLNERISNLISAQTALKRNLALQENSSLLDSHTLFSAGAKAVKNTVASAPVRTFASKILNAGNALAEPEVVPQQTGAAATAKARFQAARAAAESKSNAVPVDDLQGGHAGNGVSSVEEISRPGTNYVVSKGGQLTYHGKTFAPESTPAGSSHVTILPDGTIRVNGGPELTPAQIFAIRRSIPSQARAAKAGDD